MQQDRIAERKNGTLHSPGDWGFWSTTLQQTSTNVPQKYEEELYPTPMYNSEIHPIWAVSPLFLVHGHSCQHGSTLN